MRNHFFIYFDSTFDSLICSTESPAAVVVVNVDVDVVVVVVVVKVARASAR